MYLSSGPRSLYEPEYVSCARAASSRCPAQYISCDQLCIRIRVQKKTRQSSLEIPTQARTQVRNVLPFQLRLNDLSESRIPNPESTFYQPSALPERNKHTYGEICIDVPVVLLCAPYVVDGFFDELAQFRVGCDFESIARRFEPFRYVRIPGKMGEMPVW